MDQVLLSVLENHAYAWQSMEVFLYPRMSKG
jgi:hypothetical protein